MSSVDERIVQMRFDNAQFERGAQTSMKTLDKLKQSLKLTDAAKGLSNLEKVGNNLDLSGLSAGVDTISSRFTNLGIIGVTALQNITNAAMRAGINIIKSLTIEPVMTGFNEYETKMNAITTILTNTQSKGTTLDDVNEALAELNEYADQTIYNFAEMTRNIGTFTAAGVDLDTSVKAIKGIANLAAGSGSTSQQASNAMYQLSQALAAGRVSLQDWNSVVNAGMGGELFQNALKETAKQMGIVVDESVSFRESISAAGGNESWLTSDVLIKTLERFADDETLTKAATQVKTVTQLVDTMKESVQSGWAQSWEYIIGDREQAIETLTAVSDAFNGIIQPSTDARNAVLKFWNENGGRDALINAISNSFKALSQVLGPVGKAFKSLLPNITGEGLVSFSKGLENLTGMFVLSDESAAKLERTFDGLFSIFRLGRDAVAGFVSSFVQLATSLIPTNIGILDVTARIGDFLTEVASVARQTDVLDVALSSVGDVLGYFSTQINFAVGKLSEFLEYLKVNFAIPGLERAQVILDNVTVALGNFKNSATDAFGTVQNTASAGLDSANDKLQSFFDFVSGIRDALSSFGNKIKDAFGGIASRVGSAFEGVNITDVIGTGMLGGIVVLVRKVVKGFSDVTSNLSDVIDGVVDVLDSARGALEAWQQSLKASVLLKIAGAVAILAAALIALTFIDGQKLQSGLMGVSILLAEVVASMKLLNTFQISGITGAATSMVIIAAAVSILAGALVKLQAFQDWDSTWPALVSMGAILAGLSASAKILSTTASGAELIKTSIGLVVFSVAVSRLATAMQTFGDLEVSEIQKGLLALGALLGEIAIFLKVSNIGQLSGGKKAIIEVAFSMLALYAAVKLLGGLETDILVKGLASTGALMAGLAVAIRIMGSVNMSGVAMSLISMATALTIMIVPITQLGNIKTNVLVQGLVSVGLALAAMTASLKILSGTGSLGAAAGLVLMATALTILIVPIKVLGSMPWQALAVGLGALVVVLVALGAAGTILGPLAPAILAVAGAFTLFGIAITGIGAGVALLAVGLATLGTVGSAGALALVAALSVIVVGVAKLIPTVATALASGIITFATTIAAGAPTLAEAAVVLITAILTALQGTVPALMETAAILLQALLTTIESYFPNILQTGINIILNFIKGISDNIYQIVDTAVQLVVKFVEAVGTQIPVVVEAALNLIIEFIEGLADAIRNADISRLLEAVADLAMAIVEGLVNGLVSGVGMIVDGVLDLGSSALQALADFLGIASPSKEFRTLGEYSSQGFAEGIDSESGAIEASLTAMADRSLAAMEAKAPQFTETGRTAARRIAEGMRLGLDEAAISITNMLDNMIRRMSSSMVRFQESGRQIITVFIESINNTIELNVLYAMSSMSSLFKSMIYVAEEVLNNSHTRLQNDMRNLLNAMLEAAKSYVGRFRDEVGSAIPDGIAEGINNNRSSAINAAASVASDALNAAKSRLGIASPSKKFALLGRYVDEGFASGISSYSGLVDRSAKEIGTAAISGANSVLNTLNALLENGMELSPTIRPVLDTSMINPGMGYLNNAFRNPSFSGLNGSYNTSGVLRASYSLGRSQEARMTKDYGPDILDAFDTLGARVDALGNRIAQMKMVLDTGAAVGGMSQKMDQKLGRMANYKGRNI